MEEKEDACNSIREIAENVGKQFYPYLDECYQQVNILTEVPQTHFDVSRSGIIVYVTGYNGRWY